MVNESVSFFTKYRESPSFYKVVLRLDLNRLLGTLNHVTRYREDFLRKVVQILLRERCRSLKDQMILDFTIRRLFSILRLKCRVLC